MTKIYKPPPPKYRRGKIRYYSRLNLGGDGGGQSSGAFSPDQVAGLQLWLKADAITGLVDNDPVATWLDSSGSANDATQGTAANRPLYKTGILNGKPVVRFDATNDGMLTANNVFTALPISFFVVYMGNGNGNARRTIQGVGGANWLIGPYLNEWRVFNGGFIGAGGLTPGAFRVHTFIQNAGGGTFWLNGSLVGSNANTAVPNTIALGAAGTFVEAIDGDVAEIIGYNTDVSSQRTAIEAYLKAKWNI